MNTEGLSNKLVPSIKTTDVGLRRRVNAFFESYDEGKGRVVKTLSEQPNRRYF